MFTQSLVVIRTPVASLATILVLGASLFFLQLSFVSAQTPSALGQHKSNAELQAMISALMAQIAALQNGGTSTGASDEYGCNPGGSCLGTVLKATMQPAVQDISSAIKLVKAETTSVNGYLSGIFEIEITAQDSSLYIHTNSFNLAPVLNEKIVTQNNQKFTKTVTSTATKSGVYYVINEGETKSFKVSFSYQPIATGSYRIIMQDFSFALTATGRLFIHEMPYPNRPETDAVQYKNSVPAVVVPDTGNTITVTVPNGGESWEIGMLNTVTWKPYGYNPDVNPARDVTAYLEVKNADGSFKTLGKVQESGKASIHWPTGELNSLTAGGNYASAGNGYYIKIVNNKTGASDRSDNPFTLVAKPVDLKINGSDGPVTVSQNQPVTLSWSVSSVERCEIHNAYKDARRTTQIGSVPLSGQMVAYLHPDLSWGPTLYCYRKDGSSVYDSVKRTSVTNNTSSIVKLISPNGGEILNATQLVKVNYNAQGISTISVALYKNDMWKAWIVKDVNIQTREKVSVEFTPSEIIQGLGQGDNKGDLFKIYITGKKADGTGYIDDKSDQAFQFESGAVSVKGEAPKKNIFNCNRSVMAKVASGSIACYGMWDYGEDFGGDVKMCGSYDGKTGCVIQTPVCTSGTAKAAKYIQQITSSACCERVNSK